MAADPITRNTVGELLNYDVSDDDDIFGDIALSKTRDDKSTLSPRAAKRKADDDKENLGLGLDEEVKITKKRKPVVKLDENRLLTQPGIPKLRALARSGQLAKKLRLKGKGQEYTDAARLLNYFQLWLDDLYPRAKFADGLQLVEKAGHSKRMQSLRREWIDEGKPGYLRDREAKKAQGKEDDGNAGGDERAQVGTNHSDEGVEQANNKEKEKSNAGPPRNSIFGNGPHDDDMFFPDSDANKARDDDAAPEEDELEALLAERASAPSSEPSKPVQAFFDSETEDDLDALLAEQETVRHSATTSGPTSKTRSIFDVHDDNDDDDLDAILAEQEVRRTVPMLAEKSQEVVKPVPDAVNAEAGPEDDIFPSSPVPNDEINDDELEALLAEQELQARPKAEEQPPETRHGPVAGDESQGKESTVIFSSSPIPNDEMDDALLNL